MQNVSISISWNWSERGVCASGANVVAIILGIISLSLSFLSELFTHSPRRLVVGFWNFARAETFPLVSMGGWAEGQACADPGVRTPIFASEFFSLSTLPPQCGNSTNESKFEGGNLPYICVFEFPTCPLNILYSFTFPLFWKNIYKLHSRKTNSCVNIKGNGHIYYLKWSYQTDSFT